MVFRAGLLDPAQEMLLDFGSSFFAISGSFVTSLVQDHCIVNKLVRMRKRVCFVNKNKQ